jgi:hypothetical protein
VHRLHCTELARQTVALGQPAKNSREAHHFRKDETHAIAAARRAEPYHAGRTWIGLLCGMAHLHPEPPSGGWDKPGGGFDRVLGAGQAPEAADLMQGITWCLDGRQLASTVADEPLRGA